MSSTMTKKNILCYSKFDFDNLMNNNNWIDNIPMNYAVISICSPNEYYMSEHWFKKDYSNSDNVNIFNLDIDDGGPIFNDEYDKALELYLNDDIYKSNEYFSKDFNIHYLDYQQAFKLAMWIHYWIHKVDTIYIHCAAGLSRSQGVVRYILDTYSDMFDIHINENNPCITPNMHVVRMLKRAYRNLYMN